MNIAQTLIDLEKKITKAKNDSIATRAKIDSIMERLDKEFGIKTIEQAEEMLVMMDAEIINMEKDLEALVLSLGKELSDMESRLV